MNLLKLSPDSSFPNDSIYDSSILFINESEFIENSPKLNRSFSSSSSSLRRTVLGDGLDLTRISDRILVASRCWTNTNDTMNGNRCNKTEELAEFLNNKYKDKYLLWNIGTPESLANPSCFEHRIIPFVLPKSQSHTLKTIFHLCHSILGWLSLSPENVIIIQCADGWNRSGLLTSCLLKFSNQIETTFDGLNLFQSRRLKSKNLKINFKEFSKINLRYLKYFNETIEQFGRIQNPSPLCLHQIIISTIPNFDGTGNCSPGLEIFQNNELILSSNLISDKTSLNSEIYLFKDDYNIIFKLKENHLERDILLHIFHSHPKTGQRSTILSFTFNTSFFNPGVIRLRSEDLEMPLKDVEAPSLIFPDSSRMKSGQKRFKQDFCVDLILLPIKNDENLMTVDYTSTVRNNLAKNLLRLSQMHPIRPDRTLLPPLLLQAFPKFYSKLALQIYANDIHRAHEYLEKLRREGEMKDLEKSFLELTCGTAAAKDDVAGESIKKDDVEEVESCLIEPEIKDKITVYVNEHVKDATIVDANEEIAITLESVNPAIVDNKDTIETSDILSADETVSTSKTCIEATDSRDNCAKTEVKVTDAVVITDQTIKTETTPKPDTIENQDLPKKATPLPSFSGIGIKNDDNIKTNDNIKANDYNIPPPPPPLPAPRLPPPPPPPLPGKLSGIPPPPSQVNTVEKPRIKNSLNWNELQLPDDSSSIWHEISEIDLPLNTKKFEELFCIDLRHEKQKTSISSNNTTENLVDVPVVIDIRRANNVGIGLSRFQRRFENFDELLKAVYGNLLDLDDFLTLKTILPIEEEVKNLRLIKKTDKMLLERMGKAEQFLFLVTNKYTDLSKVIDYKIFELSCWQDFEGLKEKFELIGQVLNSLKSSDELKIILKATLDLGNLATYEYGRGYPNSHSRYRKNSASGFTLDSLCKLHEVKSVNGQSNLLIFLTSSLAQAHPQVLSLTKREEFKELELIKSWSDKQLIQEFKELERITTNWIKDSKLQEADDDDFWREANKKLTQFKTHLITLNNQIDSFQSTWKITKLYFGLDNNGEEEPDLSEFLTNIWQFFKNFETAIKQVKRNDSGSHDTLLLSSSSETC